MTTTALRRDTDHPDRAEAASARARRRRRWLVPLAVAPAALAVAVTTPANPAAGAPSPPPAVRAAAVAAAAPVAEVVAPAPVEHAPTTHVVQPGETLSHVAVRHGVSASTIAAANGLADPDLVRSGTTLTIPAGGAGAATSATDISDATPVVSTSTSGLPERLQASPERLAYIPVFDHWAAANGIPADLLKAMTWLESGWQQGQVSSTGAVGIGQLMPDTVDHMEMLIGVDLNQYSAEDNIRMSARFLRFLLHRYGTASEALAAYYQGPASVEANGTYAETDRYVANVLALRSQF